MENFKKLEISQKNLYGNLEKIKKIANNKKICVMVKANAYGHGINKICRLLENKVDFFGVANINEALKIRAITNNKILIVGKTYEFDLCIKNNISFAIDGARHLEKLINFLNKKPTNNCINIHIKVNTGMNRLGVCDINEFKKLYYLCEENKINVEGVFTHFSTADCDSTFFLKQLKIFDNFINEIPKRNLPMVHVGGSGVLTQIVNGVNFEFDMIRVGIALYGYCKGLKVKPVLKIKSNLIKVFTVEKGERVGYSNGFIATKQTKIGIVPLGYADGVYRKLKAGGLVKIKNKKYKIIGNVCMDMFFVDLTNSNINEGEEVVVFEDAKKWAQILGTIPYEILTNFSLVR